LNGHSPVERAGVTGTTTQGILFRLARLLALAAGAMLSLLAIYQWMITVQLVNGQPLLIIPDSDYWNSALLAEAQTGLGLPSGFFAAYALGLTLLFNLAFLICGWLILWRKNSDWFGLYLGVILLIWANGIGVFYSMPDYAPWLEAANSYLAWLGWPGLFLLLYFFPSGHITPIWARWFAAALGIFILYGLVITIFEIDVVSLAIAMPIIVVCLLVGGYAQIYRYRHAGALERQQVKWVVLALLAYILFFISLALLINVLRIGDPGIYNLHTALIGSLVLLTVGNLAYMALPISITIALLRYRLWDVDIILRRTLVYAALTLTLGLIFFGSITVLQLTFSAATGQRSPIATVASTLLIAALVTPLRRRIQRDIDRRFFRQKYNAAQAIERFAAVAREQTDLEQLTAELLAVVAETMQPENVSLWISPAKRERQTSSVK
jgi:hypothetical protein